MRPNAELRLFAVPLCNGLVCSVMMASLNGVQGSVVFPAFLYGVISAALLGIPLLLLGDRRCARFSARHMVSALIQALIAYLVFGKYSLLLSLLGGLTLGALYLVVIPWVEKLPVKGAALQRKSMGTVVAVPLSGGVTLGAAALIVIPPDDSGLPLFLVSFFIGSLLSMVVSWPMLWLVERFVTTRWRYVIGGVLSSLFIWLMIAAPSLVPGFYTLTEHPVEWSPMFWKGAASFLLIGLIAGLLCTALNWFFERYRRRA
jgi:hypothetical protein